MSLDFDARLFDRAFDARLTIEAGETVAVLGPNGAGKSTLLGLIAGLLHADSGRATLDGSALFDRSAGNFTAPHARGVSLLAQDALLFPHLSVLENVAFGPRSAGAGRLESRATAKGWLTEVDALEFAARRPAELSGGQAQRVAVARALASNPRLLLLDEPLAALDVAAAPALRRVLRRVLADRTAIIVTHDLVDALLLADRVVVLESGRVVEQGRTRDVLAHPRTVFLARLAGLNLLTGVRTGSGIRSAEGFEVAADWTIPSAVGSRAAAAIRPSAVRVSLERPTVSTANVLRAVVNDLEPHGDVVRARSEWLAADLTPARVADLDLAPGDSVWFAFSRDDTVLYPL